MTNWSGQEYAKVSSLQRAMIDEAKAGLALAAGDRVLDVGCGDGFLTRDMTRALSSGYAVGVDASMLMVASAKAAVDPGTSGPWFVVADARALPFGEHFDVVVSFNALHWVSEQQRALMQIASVLRPAGRAVIQVVCAGERPSLEAVTMTVCRRSRWVSWFDGFAAPFVHVDPDTYAALAASAGLTLAHLTVTDREWNFGSRDRFREWCAVGSTAWTDRLPVSERDQFVDDQVDAYQKVVGSPGLFRFTQMRAELRRPTFASPGSMQP